MKLGTENKKQIYWLGGLLLVLAVVFYMNVLSGPDTPPAQPRAPRPAAAAQQEPPAPAAQQPALIPGFGRQQGAPAPVVRARPPLRGTPRGAVQFKMAAERGLDLTTIDPTLRLDLLAKVRGVNLAGGERNLFQFGAAPMPKTPEPKIIPKPAVQGPPLPPPEVKPVEPVKPPPPPIPLKFFGYSQGRPGVKRAFFLDGEEILVVNEGELAKKRYRVVRIGIGSVVVEDTEHQNQQTLALEPEPGRAG